MGYQLKDHDPYIITGKEGREYRIPAPIDMNLDEIELMLNYNSSKDEIEKTKMCKEYLLHFAPDLENEGISDMEYFLIFQDYNESCLIKKKNNKLGES